MRRILIAVEGWTRSGKAADKPYPIRAVDISDRAAVTAAARSFDAVIHCASSGGGGAESYRQIYFEGARNLIAELRPQIFLYTSSTSVYAQTGGEWVDEESAAEPGHETGRILRATEDLVRQQGGTVARLAGIYGPGRSALLRNLLSGEARIETGEPRYLNQVHRDDIATSLFQLVNTPNDSQIFNVTDDQPLTQRACYEWLAQKLQRPPPPTAAPGGERKRGASNKRVANQKLRARGWRPHFPKRDGAIGPARLVGSRCLRIRPVRRRTEPASAVRLLSGKPTRHWRARSRS
jgi:nucleoside-diphosphate-sugar epimerase